MTKKYFADAELAGLARRFRLRSGRKKKEAALELGVGRPSVQHAEETPEQCLTKLRIRMIEKYSPYKVVGPVYLLQKK